MKYGYFDDANKEYVIENALTPWPWINYLGNQDFFSLVSNTSGGYSFYKDPLFRRITRYRYNNVPMDQGGRYFYIKEGDSVWNPGFKPSKTELDAYECRHGLGYTRIMGKKKGLRVETLFFVPLNFQGEVQKVSLKNESDEVKNFSLYSMVEFCLWNAQDDMTNFQRNFSTGEVEIVEGTVYHKTEYRERRNHFSFYHAGETPDGFDTDRETFVGLYNDFGDPQQVLAGTSGNSVASGWSPIASHRFDISLKPGEEKEIAFILGYVENDEDKKWESPGIINKENALEMIKAYGTPAKADAGLQELKDYWNDLLSRFTVDHPDEKLSRMVNIWNQYQCMVTYNLARSASFFESGIGRGLGFRDTNQDLLGFVHQIPERAKERILDVAATQMVDGGCYHQYQPLTKKGNNDIGGNFNDDPLWLLASVSAYIRETGDWDILNIEVPYENDESLSKPLFDHLRVSFNHVIENLGPHDLPLIGRADWNDCLNLNCFSTNPNESYQTCTNKEGKTAESVFIAGMFVYYGEEYARICELSGKETEAKRVRSEVQKMNEVVQKHGWDGDWYLRAYDDFGNKVGSDECEEGKIFIESQGFCSMAGIGLENKMPQKALESVEKHLATPYGIVLNEPTFKSYHIELGEISSYPPGYKENGGIFCHNNPWVVIGETVVKNGDRAFDYFKRICPAYLEEISDIHRTEPYVYSQMIAGKDAVRHGEAKNSWLTGTAAWNFVAITQHILGIRSEFEGLLVNPCFPQEWKEYTVTKHFRNADYSIRIINKTGEGHTVKSMIVDDKAIEGNLIPIFGDEKLHVVEVTL